MEQRCLSLHSQIVSSFELLLGALVGTSENCIQFGSYNCPICSSCDLEKHTVNGKHLSKQFFKNPNCRRVTLSLMEESIALSGS
jgi:transposase-like protein